jgi:acyl-CoA-binding protein
MSDLDARFEQAAADAQTLSERPDNDTLLEMYALFKQGKEGDVSGKRPGMMAMVKRAKFDAWAKQKGTSKDAAKEAYIALVEKLKG